MSVAPRGGDAQTKTWRVVLVGDSNARQYIPALRELVPELGAELHAAVRLRCPFTDLRPYPRGELDAECVRWVEETMAALEHNPPDVLLVTSSYDNYLSVNGWRFDAPDGSARYLERGAQVEAMRCSTQRLTARLLDAGVKHIAFIKPTPKFRTREAFERGEGDPSIRFAAGCSLVKLWFFRGSCDATRPLVEGVESAQWADVRFGRVVYEGVLDGERVHEVVVDEELYPGGACRSSQGGVWLYRDAGHMWPAGARRTKPAFRRFLSTLMAR